MVDLKFSELKKYSWEEVKKHNTAADCWLVLEREVAGEKKGLVLDVTEWAGRHPGGSIIYDGAGGDCTIMFWSYHPLSMIDNCGPYIQKLVIGEVEDYKCLYELGSKFHRTLKSKVESTIPASERRSDWRMWLKSFLLTTAIILSFWMGWINGYLPAVFAFGFLMSQTGLNMMHDGIHSAYSKSQIICTLASFTFNLCGCNYIAYRRAHAFGHHAYTNHLEYDTGITGSFPVLRLHNRLGHRWFHHLQHLYVIPIYLFGIFLFWLGDWEDMHTFYNFPKRYGPASVRQWMVTAFGKILFLFWYIVLPFSLFHWQKASLHCLIVCIEIGCCALLFFVVNHWTDKAALITNKDLINHTSDWAMLQVLTSSNFSNKSWFWLHISGGLNLQIEHHLFPGIIHTRLPEIHPHVRETCLEFGLRYDDQCYESFWSALKGNIAFIKNLGSGRSEGKFPAIGKRKHA